MILVLLNKDEERKTFVAELDTSARCRPAVHTYISATNFSDTNFQPFQVVLGIEMSAEEVTEEVEALIAILEEDTVEVVKGEDGERPKVKHQSQHFPMHLLAVMLTAVMFQAMCRFAGQ